MHLPVHMSKLSQRQLLRQNNEFIVSRSSYTPVAAGMGVYPGSAILIGLSCVLPSPQVRWTDPGGRGALFKFRQVVIIGRRCGNAVEGGSTVPADLRSGEG